ncbi:MAG: hypothetical protein K2O39_05500 [Clostridiales bacterium]|nr:hypothetical protein [Clostridiales bacterium]
MAKIKTINFRFMLWFGTVFAIGAVAVSLMIRSIICDGLQIAWPVYFLFSLFGPVGIVGLTGIIVLLRKYLILKIVLKYGTETVGKYVDIGKYITWGGSRYRGG